MHCVSAYPCDDKNVDLSRIVKLKKITNNIGLSDHSSDILSCLFSLTHAFP